MRLKLDENLSRHLKPALIALGHDLTTAADEGLLGQPDAAIAGAAKRERRILLTLDVQFANLRKYAPGSHPGIILFRPRSYGPLAVNRFVEKFVREADWDALKGCLAVVDPLRLRIRRPERGSAQD